MNSWIVSLLSHARQSIDGCMAGVESAAFPGQKEEEVDRLLHIVSFVYRSQQALA